MNLRSPKFALLLGAINGFVFGVAYQPVSKSIREYVQWQEKKEREIERLQGNLFGQAED